MKEIANPEQADGIFEVESIKHLSNKEQAEKIADKFAELSNEYQPLDRSKINFPYFEDHDVPVFKEEEVLEVLLDLKVNKSSRSTDVPSRVLKAFAHKLCKPMTIVINNALQCGTWYMA